MGTLVAVLALKRSMPISEIGIGNEVRTPSPATSPFDRSEDHSHNKDPTI